MFKNLRSESTPAAGRAGGACSLAVAALLASPAVNGATFQWGETTVTFDTTLSAGVTIRAEDADLTGSPSLGNEIFSDAGDVTSLVLRGVHDLDIRRGNYGLFARGTYLVDPIILDEDEIPRRSRREAGRNAELLDAFLYGSGTVAGLPVYGRVGNQVVSWGESTFFTLGINTFNPVYVPASRLPGAEVREILRPVPVALGGVDLTSNLQLEAFAQLMWRETELDPVGTFFSTADAFGPGSPGLQLAPGLFVPREGDNDASDTGAFGVSLRYMTPLFGYTELGLYYLNYHSHLPFLNMTPTTDPADPTTATYFQDYPEDIELVGVSFNTPVGAFAVQGEYSYRDNLPIQLNPEGFIPVFLGGETTATYERFGYSQAQVTATRVFNQGVIPTTSGAAWVTEIGYGRVHDYPGDGVLGDVTEEAYGFRTMLVPEWNAAMRIPGIGVFDLVATIDYAYSIEGVSPAGGPFLEGAHALNLGLEAIHMNRLSLQAVYSTQWGADDPEDPPYNVAHDRDFVQFNVKYSF